MKTRATLAGLLMAAGLFVAPVLAAAPAHADDPVAPAESTKAATWLADQFVDGEHLLGFDGSADPSNTIDGVLALYQAGVGTEVADQATDWVVAQASDYVTSPGSAARAAILADVADIDPTDFGGVDLVEAMSGDLGDLASNPYGLGLLVIALERSEVEVPAGVLDALLATQEEAGSFGFPGFGTDLDATAMAVQALATVDGNSDAAAALTKGVDWLADNQCDAVSDGCPEAGAYWGSFSPANTSALVIPALADAGIDTTDQLAWLVDQQLADGSFPAGLGLTDGDAYATAQAILGLNSVTLAEVERNGSAPASSGADTPATGESGGEFDSAAEFFTPSMIIGLAAAAAVVLGATAFMIGRKK